MHDEPAIANVTGSGFQNKKSSLKTWVIVTNSAYLFSIIAVYLLMLMRYIDGMEYIVLGTMGIAFIVVFLVFITLSIINFVSAIASIVLNAVYLPKLYKGSTSVALIRILLVIVNIIALFGVNYLLSMSFPY
jgi:hypothetical protein